MLDATKPEEQRRLLEIELDAVGIRLNRKKPDVVFKRKTTGGVSVAIYFDAIGMWYPERTSLFDPLNQDHGELVLDHESFSVELI